MLSRRLVCALFTALVASSLGAAAPPSASAAVDLTATLDLPTGVTASVTGSSAAAHAPFNDFPARGASYLVLSTGDAARVVREAPLQVDDPRTPEYEREPDYQLSTDGGADGSPDQARLSLVVEPSAAGCLLIDFAMATDEAVRVQVPDAPGDFMSIVRRAAPETEYAVNAGRGYFAQESWPAQPRRYTVNAIDYWHEPGDRSDVLDSQLEVPRLARWTPLNRVTTKDTARIPLDFSQGADVVDLVVSDHGNGDVDTAALVDNVRTAPTCGAGTGVHPVHPYGEGSIKGERRVGYPLSYDPIPSTLQVERYDAADNGWAHPAPAAPVELRFRWYRTPLTVCTPTQAYDTNMAHWVPIRDADRQSYVPTTLDRNKCLIVLVTGIVDGRRMETFPPTGDATANPSQWYVTLPIDSGVFQDGSTPTIVADDPPTVNQTITVRPVATRPLQDSWTYQWSADGVAISGATSSELVLGAAQVGKRITVRATAHRSGFDSRGWTSAPTTPVEGLDMSAGEPVVRDAAGEVAVGTVVGDTVTADPGPGWEQGTAFTYQWQRDGSNIAGATSPTYTAGTADAGTSLRVRVIGAKPGYNPVSALSPAIAVHGIPMKGVTPTITGTPKVGATLHGSAEGWSPSGATLRYAWYAGDTLLGEGTRASLTVPSGAVGQQIVLAVTGTRTGYERTTRRSEPTGSVARGTLTAATPRISGYAKVGQTLTAAPGYWGPSGVRLSFRWKVGSTVVSGPAGATQSFKIPRSARGKRITVAVTGRLAGYTPARRVSDPTARVVP